ncbi:hypothetical protein MICRO11B_370013 [Micrococcus luteus]|nr:hypothetical protein MICRO11B_370013 [Micrococcus luteus]
MAVAHCTAAPQPVLLEEAVE